MASADPRPMILCAHCAGVDDGRRTWREGRSKRFTPASRRKCVCLMNSYEFLRATTREERATRASIRQEAALFSKRRSKVRRLRGASGGGTNYDSDMHGKFRCSRDKRKGVCMAQTSLWSIGFCIGFGSGGHGRRDRLVSVICRLIRWGAWRLFGLIRQRHVVHVLVLGSHNLLRERRGVQCRYLSRSVHVHR